MDTPNEITAVHSRRGSKRREVDLDGSPWRAMPLAVLNAVGIASGDVIDPDDIAARILALEPAAARERAMRLLAYRDRSESEMRARLTDDGYTGDCVEETIKWLLDTGLLNDDRFAEQFARTLVVGRHYGRTRSLQRLRRSGLPDDVALRALDEIAPAEDERERAALLARTLYRTGDSLERLASRLVRRGYAPGDALSAARHVLDTVDTTDQASVDDD